MLGTDAVDGQDARRILDALDVGVVIQDADYRITYANARASELLGLATREIEDRTTHDRRWDVIGPDGAVVADDGHPAVRALRTGLPVRDVVLGVRRGEAAERVWILAAATPQLGADGRPVRVIVTFSDVSTAHRAFRAQEATYQSVFRSMSEGIVVHDRDGSIRTANAAAERVLGLTVDQLAGRAATDPRWKLTLPDGGPVDPATIPSERALKTGRAAPETLLGVHHPSGELAWLSVRADPLYEPGETALRGVVATFTDVTRERQTTLALEASRAQVQRVLDAVPGIVYQYLHPLEGPDRIGFVGGRIGEFLGIDPERVKSNPSMAFDLITEAERTRLFEAIDATVRQRSMFDHTLPYEVPTGGTRWLKLQGLPEETPEGVMYTGVITDVTEAHRLSEVLRRTQRREAMGEMAAGIAHNFNNMLAVILPNLEMALTEPGVGVEARSMLQSAERAARSAADLVHRMLVLARPEAPDVTAGAVDLGAIVREALHICQQTFDRHIRIVSELIDGPVPVRGRAGDLQHVVLNLCLNARDALAGVAAPAIVVRLSHDPAGFVLLEVVDNGRGMSDAVLRRVGEPFFTTKGPGKGTGLGLASAIATVTEVGGRWNVESAPGQGTSFALRWPRAGSIDVAPAAPAPRAAEVKAGTVLVVDDEPLVREALAATLRRAGIPAVPCAGGQQALSLIREGQLPGLAVILFDLSMPGMSGAQALPLLREAAPGVPCLVLSGHVPEGTPLEGAFAVLEKPIGKVALLDAVRRAMAHAPVRGAR